MAGTLKYWDGTQWVIAQGPPGTAGAQGPAGAGTGPAGGCLSGTYPNPNVANFWDYGSSILRAINGNPRRVGNVLAWGADPDLSNNFSWNAQGVVNSIAIGNGLTGTTSNGDGTGNTTIQTKLIYQQASMSADINSMVAGTVYNACVVYGTAGWTYLIAWNATFYVAGGSPELVNAWCSDQVNTSSQTSGSLYLGASGYWGSISGTKIWNCVAGATAMCLQVHSPGNGVLCKASNQAGAWGATNISLVLMGPT